MKNGNWKAYAFWIILAEAVGGLAGWLTRAGVQLYNTTAVKPPLSPPQWVFPIVWGILYALMGVSAARIAKTDSKTGLNIFIGQLVINFFWPLLFFNAGAYGFAAIWLAILWLLVLAMILVFRRSDPVAAWLQIPYLLWLTFALYLNVGAWALNR